MSPFGQGQVIMRHDICDSRADDQGNNPDVEELHF